MGGGEYVNNSINKLYIVNYGCPHDKFVSCHAIKTCKLADLNMNYEVCYPTTLQFNDNRMNGQPGSLSKRNVQKI